MNSGKSSDKQSFLETSLDLGASHDVVSFKRATATAVSFVFFITRADYVGWRGG